MLKKIVRDILIIAGLLIIGISTSHRCMNWLSDKRNENETWWGVHKEVEGDLVGMSYLHYVKKFSSLRDYAFEKNTYPNQKVDLYAQGDSYIWKIPDTAYAGIKNYKYGWRYRDNINYRLDSTQTNILLIEIAERYVRSYLSGTNIFSYVKKDAVAMYKPQAKNYAAIAIPGIDNLFNPFINQNLEYNLFNYNFINPVRRWKASMTYYLFARASGDVAISENQKQLYLKETVAGKRVENTYYPIGQKELDNIINSLNTIYDHYKADGFDEVYLSIIPNPATILQPKGYNQLIPSIEHHPALKIKTISVYDTYQHTTKTIYRPGDTHWNNEGLQLWLAKVNKMLIMHNELR